MSTHPTYDPSENTTANQEKPLMALAIGALPARLIPEWGINASGVTDEHGDGSEPEWALAIGPSGPAIRPLSEAELAVLASAENFNLYHDELGRFTTSGQAVVPTNKDGQHSQATEKPHDKSRNGLIAQTLLFVAQL